MIWRLLEGMVEGVARVFVGAIFFLPLLLCIGLAAAGWVTGDTMVILAALGATLVTVIVGGTVAGWVRFR